MQQSLRGNASAIDANAAGVRFGVDERGAQTKISGQECRRIATGPSADDHELG
jgi:hypothetical protein